MAWPDETAMTLREQIEAASELYEKSPNALSLTLFGHLLVDTYRAGKLIVIEDEAEAVRDMLATALVILTREGHRADTLECLTHGDSRGTVPPKTLERAITAALAALRGE